MTLTSSVSTGSINDDEGGDSDERVEAKGGGGDKSTKDYLKMMEMGEINFDEMFDEDEFEDDIDEEVEAFRARLESAYKADAPKQKLSLGSVSFSLPG